MFTVTCECKRSTWNSSLPQVKFIFLDWLTWCLKSHALLALLKTNISRLKANISPKHVLASVQYWETLVIAFSHLWSITDSALNRMILKFPVMYDFLCTVYFTCMFYMTCKCELIRAKGCDYGTEYGLQ
jgi:hypothetical protein